MEAVTLDFSHVNSREKAEALFREGKLERLYLFPLEFGGQEIAQNTMYVPPGVAAIKQRLDGSSTAGAALPRCWRLPRKGTAGPVIRSPADRGS